MAGKVLTIDNILQPDRMAQQISRWFIQWDTLRMQKVQQWKEIQQYVFATDTTQTSNAKLPWSNKTTLPKLCQIRDNLSANYMATLFPRRHWLEWEGNSEADEEKAETIESYMDWVVDRNEFYEEASKILVDYIDYGNCFATVEWVDKSYTTEDGEKVGYCGPLLRRISPLDIVFNPTASTFSETPKIIRSIVSLGEVKEMLERQAITDEERQSAQELYDYMKNIRLKVGDHPGNASTKDDIYNIAGFTSYKNYLDSTNVEVLTFYGDIYNQEEDTFLRNHIVQVVDRHKIAFKGPNPSSLGHAPIYHCGWRIRPDNLWAMGPLDNLVGMQYRIDHLENLKADVFDLIAYPVIKVKGYVEEFNWAPNERIHVGDDGDVALVSPDTNALQADNQIAILEAKMEEMAGSPKEAMGFRTPGEKTMYEVQRLENAASRIFQNKTAQIERQLFEPCLNAMLELSRRYMNGSTVRILDDELKVAVFTDLTTNDITGTGRLKPIAARHFAEKAMMVQNITNFMGSAAGQDQEVRMHFSSVQLAKMFECVLELEEFNLVQPWIRITEQHEAERMNNSQQEQTAMQTMTPGGIMPGDHDL